MTIARCARMQCSSEHTEMVALARWLDFVGVLWAHPANEGKRSWRNGARLKAEGLRKGLPDVLVFSPPPSLKGAKGMAIELKRERGGKVSEDQRRWLIELAAIGWVAIIARGAREAIAELQKYGYGFNESRIGGRVVQGAGLLSQYGDPVEGSNPSLSANRAGVAQLAEQTENPELGDVGSSPTAGNKIERRVITP